MPDTSHLVPTCIIYLDGARINPAYESAFRSVKVIDTLNKVSDCFIFFDAQELRQAQVPLLDFDTPLSVHLGYKDHTQQVFSGEITTCGISRPQYGPQRIRIIASSLLHRLEHGRHRRHFEHKSHAQIITALLDRYGLRSSLDTFGSPYSYWEGGDQTDLQLLLDLAERHGRDVYTWENTVHVKTQMKVRRDDIIYERGKNLIHFEVKENCLKQVSGVTYLGWDMYREKGFRARVGIEELEEKVGGRKDWRQQGKGGGGKWESTYADYSLRDQKEARERAEAKLRNLSYQYLKAEGSGEGNSALLAGMRVLMKQVGKAYSGEYIAEVVIHELSEEEGYITRFFLKRNMMDEEFGKGETVVDRHADEAYRAKREAAAEKRKREADEDEDGEAEDKSPQFSNLRWVKKGKDAKEALVDDEVSLCFDVQNINNGQRIKITIWEHDDDNEHDHVADLTGTVENGQIAKIWKVVYTPDEDDGSTSAQELKEKGYTLPEYHFVAEYKGVVSGESPVLEVKDWVKKRLRDKSSNVIFKNTKYTLRLADGKEINGITDAMGYMQEIYAVPFGILNISIDKDLQ